MLCSIKEPGLYDYVIFNDDLEDAYAQLVLVAKRALSGKQGNGSPSITGPVTLVAEEDSSQPMEPSLAPAPASAQVSALLTAREGIWHVPDRLQCVRLASFSQHHISSSAQNLDRAFARVAFLASKCSSALMPLAETWVGAFTIGFFWTFVCLLICWGCCTAFIITGSYTAGSG